VVRRLRGQRPEVDVFWAVREVSFAVRRGETVGICGPNGAGKSTMLKLIARIFEVTHGSIVIRGRLATMLELGTGFLPDMTGRQNLTLNGAILGLSDREMRDKMDEIIEFADIGEFIDSPVRTYSTGMYMRLGFAIAGHVEADLLLLDEVLSVGDAEFQQKCLSWLGRLKREGAAVMLVSHDLDELEQRCDRILWMDAGQVVADGLPGEIIPRYRQSCAGAP